MMIGVAQVIGIKPILSCFFSIAPGVDKASSAAFSIEKISEIAASVVPIPTAARNARRDAASGSTARTMAVSNVAVRCASTAVSCAALLVCKPQLHLPFLLASIRYGSAPRYKGQGVQQPCHFIGQR